MKKLKVRIKTEEEFKADNMWDENNNVPKYWNDFGDMNYLLGKDIVVKKEETSIFYRFDGWFLLEKDFAEIYGEV